MSTALGEDALAAALEAWELHAPVHLSPIPGGFSSNAWLIDTGGGHYVAKYAYDAQRAFDDGLRAGEVLARSGVVCAAPVRTRAGEVSILIEGPHGRTEPLALLQFVPGQLFDWTRPDAPARTGSFLGHIHAVWHAAADQPRPSDRIFAYIATPSPEVRAQPGLADLIARALANVRRFEADVPVTYGTTIGDYMELLHDTAADTLGLIDFGATSWGPLLFDVAIMRDYFPEDEQGSGRRRAFLAAYQAAAPLHPRELEGLDRYAALHMAQLATYFAWRLAHNVTLGDPDPDANASSLAEIREALEQLL